MSIEDELKTLDVMNINEANEQYQFLFKSAISDESKETIVVLALKLLTDLIN